MTERISPLRRVPLLSRQRQAGYGIVELMVGMFLGLLIIGGAIGMYVRNQHTYRTSEALSRIQENMRTSFEIMSKELREAGGTVCGAKVVANVLNDRETKWSSNWAGGTLIGYEAGTDAPGVDTGTDVAERLETTDAIQIMSGTLGNSVAITAQVNSPPTSTITLRDATGFSDDDHVIACDGSTAAIFQIASVTGNTLSFTATPGGATGNCTTDLGFPTPPLPCSSGGPTKTFDNSGFLTRLESSTWYIGANDRGGRSLYRKTSSTTEEIAEGVTDMQVSFLLRDKSTRDLDSDWLNSDDVDAADWTDSGTKEVVAVRVTLTFQSLSSVGIDNSPLERELIFVANLRSRSI